MSGWNLKNGIITDYCVSEDRYWSLFNRVFTDVSRKRNTYKYGFIKSMLDSIFNLRLLDDGTGYYISYYDLFSKFAENYWNLVVKYNIRQMRRDGKSEYSKVELILKEAVTVNPAAGNLEFSSIDETSKESIKKLVTTECKKYVVGALYDDLEGTVYSFDLKELGIVVAPLAYEFMLKYKSELEQLNYYSWAKFLETINDDENLIRVIDKLELSTPHRSDLSVYRKILRHEFEGDRCFYCGTLLKSIIHVDHFIPWSFVKDDKAWNFVLSCPNCNERKNNKLPTRDKLIRIEKRNKIIQAKQDIIIQEDFKSYSDDLLRRMWDYAKMSGFKEYLVVNKDNN